MRICPQCWGSGSTVAVADCTRCGGHGELPDPYEKPLASKPRIVCLCGSSRFYAEFQQAFYDQTMRGEIVLSIGFYPHAAAEHGHGEGVGHDSEQKIMLDELHKRKIDLADYVLVVSDITGYYGSSTLSEIRYALDRGKPVEFTQPAARERCLMQYRNKLLPWFPVARNLRRSRA